MKIKKSKRNQLIITFGDKTETEIILATAKYIENRINDNILSDDYTDILNIFNTKVIPELDYELNIKLLF